MRRVTFQHLTGLDLSTKQLALLVEYLKDFNARRAAEAVGYDPDHAYARINDPDFKLALDWVLEQRLMDALPGDIDAEWVMMELVDNHKLARQAGKLSASNTALGTIAKLAAVDAFAAEKIMQVTDKEVMERLLRGRKRVTESLSPDTPDLPPDEPEVSFI